MAARQAPCPVFPVFTPVTRGGHRFCVRVKAEKTDVPLALTNLPKVSHLETFSCKEN